MCPSGILFTSSRVNTVCDHPVHIENETLSAAGNEHHARGEGKRKALDLQGLFEFGGLYWTRTSDPIDVNDVLYQLSQQTKSLGTRDSIA